jgi:hypothetical protein
MMRYRNRFLGADRFPDFASPGIFAVAPHEVTRVDKARPLLKLVVREGLEVF